MMGSRKAANTRGILVRSLVFNGFLSQFGPLSTRLGSGHHCVYPRQDTTVRTSGGRLRLVACTWTLCVDQSCLEANRRKDLLVQQGCLPRETKEAIRQNPREFAVDCLCWRIR